MGAIRSNQADGFYTDDADTEHALDLFSSKIGS
jgi:hypothetical protein